MSQINTVQGILSVDAWMYEGDILHRKSKSYHPKSKGRGTQVWPPGLGWAVPPEGLG